MKRLLLAILDSITAIILGLAAFGCFLQAFDLW